MVQGLAVVHSGHGAHAKEDALVDTAAVDAAVVGGAAAAADTVGIPAARIPSVLVVNVDPLLGDPGQVCRKYSDGSWKTAAAELLYHGHCHNGVVPYEHPAALLAKIRRYFADEKVVPGYAESNLHWLPFQQCWLGFQHRKLAPDCVHMTAVVEDDVAAARIVSGVGAE